MPMLLLFVWKRAGHGRPVRQQRELVRPRADALHGRVVRHRAEQLHRVVVVEAEHRPVARDAAHGDVHARRRVQPVQVVLVVHPAELLLQHEQRLAGLKKSTTT